MNLGPILILTVGCCLTTCIQAQDNPSTTDKIFDLPSSFFNKLNQKTAGLEDRLAKQTGKYLQRLARHEQKLKRKLQRKDSTLAKTVFGNSPARYGEFIGKLQNNSFHVDHRKAGDYLPNVDSLNLLLSFVQNGNLNTGVSKDAASALQSMHRIQDKLKYVQDIRKYIKNRKNFITEQLSNRGLLPLQLKRINKDVYYYGQYIREYKNILNEPSKLEKAALQVLHKVPAFKEFVEKNSFLSSLFAADGGSSAANTSNAMSIPGLQTRNDVAQVINTNMISAGAGGGDILGQQLSTVKDELKRIQSRASQWDDEAEMPNFKPNEMRSKSFLQHLEFGANLQFGKSSSFVPSSADIAGQVAYKFHQNGSAGFGASYKLGFGSLRAVSFSHQGLGLRSFMDYKLKGSFFVNGGMEYNYNAAFKSIEELRAFSAWQSSALLGVSKKYKVSKKIKGNLVLLYDFLHKSHTPNTQPFVFRFGYNF